MCSLGSGTSVSSGDSSATKLLDAEFGLHIRSRLDSLNAQYRFNANLAQWFARFLRDICRYRNIDRLEQCAMLEQREVAGFEARPDFVVGERRGRDHRNAIFRRGVF